MHESVLCLIIESGRFRRVHYALTLASAAVSLNRPAILFFTLAACHALTRTAEGTPGWHSLEGEGNDSPAALDTVYARKTIGHFEELLTACHDLGVTFMVCDMGLQAEGLTRADLRQDIPVENGGLATMFHRAGPTGQIIMI